jgi:hypothetical protein
MGDTCVAWNMLDDSRNAGDSNDTILITIISLKSTGASLSQIDLSGSIYSINERSSIVATMPGMQVRLLRIVKGPGCAV